VTIRLATSDFQYVVHYDHAHRPIQHVYGDIKPQTLDTASGIPLMVERAHLQLSSVGLLLEKSFLVNDMDTLRCKFGENWSIAYVTILYTDAGRTDGHASDFIFCVMLYYALHWRDKKYSSRNSDK